MLAFSLFEESGTDGQATRKVALVSFFSFFSFSSPREATPHSASESLVDLTAVLLHHAS